MKGRSTNRLITRAAMKNTGIYLMLLYGQAEVSIVNGIASVSKSKAS